MRNKRRTSGSGRGGEKPIAARRYGARRLLLPTSRSRVPGPLWIRSQVPRVPPRFVLAEALPLRVEDAQRAWVT